MAETESLNRPMRHIPGGDVLVGSDSFYPEERPARLVSVDTFRIDEAPVTNADFAAFARATGHVTDAERAGSSLVFAFHESDAASWRIIEGACWRSPDGVVDRVEDLSQHPAVHVSQADARAFAAWAGKRLPSEIEWEAAARGGLYGLDYAWGDSLYVDAQVPARIWNGTFPAHRWEGHHPPFTSPVGQFPANGYGLLDMIGNVWELTDEESAVVGSDRHCCTGSSAERLSAIIKGGSHLCAENHCQRYRPAARQFAAEPTSHIGFRCAV
jgi:formylglycine-generating enzyme